VPDAGGVPQDALVDRAARAERLSPHDRRYIPREGIQQEGKGEVELLFNSLFLDGRHVKAARSVR
jgi:hypothetical protein